ncbi:glycosyltransferase [Candidatus Daviesbacteria bacterium]|nr:glycosyltransferase [Candidatus Daviesbacteria bacterium]
MKSPLLSVIVPIYRQEKRVVKDLRKIKAVLDKIRYRSELICVVDGMVDDTYKNAKAFAKKSSNVKLSGYENNRGKGYAVRYGMAQSKGDLIAFIDSGMDLNPNGLSMLLEHFEWYDADIVVGSKRHPVSKVDYPKIRRLFSWLYQLLTKILFGLKIRDTQVGMKLFKREVLEKVLPRLLVKQYAFDIEILAVANYLGFKRIYEAPVDLKYDFGNSSILPSKHFVKTVSLMLKDTLAIFYRLRILNYYSDVNQRKWKFDPELNFRVNIG